MMNIFEILFKVQSVLLVNINLISYHLRNLDWLNIYLKYIYEGYIKNI